MMDTDWTAVLARKHRRILTATKPPEDTMNTKKPKTPPKPLPMPKPGVPRPPR